MWSCRFGYWKSCWSLWPWDVCPKKTPFTTDARRIVVLCRRSCCLRVTSQRGMCSVTTVVRLRADIPKDWPAVESGGQRLTSRSGLCWEVVPVVICLVLVPGKLPGSVAGRRKNMSNVLKTVWLCLKTRTRLSLRNSRPSKIFTAVKQSDCLWLGPCLPRALIKAGDAAVLLIAMWTCGRDACDPSEPSLA